MLKIGLILLAFIAMVGTTTHYAFANPLCDTGGGMNMAPNPSDQGSGGGGSGDNSGGGSSNGGGSSVGPSTPTTSPGSSGGGGGGISPGDRMRFLHENGIEVIGPDTTQSNTAGEGWQQGPVHHHHHLKWGSDFWRDSHAVPIPRTEYKNGEEPETVLGDPFNFMYKSTH